eukprot:TRINITY_DN19275_c0_g1_i1.p1 TRINITY_DN19275_c0_g1~~TRINITY_DN19275_c0_g1_i1.p1  ORF type:complete len:522 (+),score=122.12 TRINITY_DN19275_c0_g1_i1:84-1568(+)
MAGTQNERDAQVAFWKEHSAVLTVEAMMLDSQASSLDEEERPEILGMLPLADGLNVVELGAGIGRFTGTLAGSAGHVLAVDFIESAIQKNKEAHSSYSNVDFQCADVTSNDLQISAGSVDLVFSNWLLMYLSDKEVEDLANKMLGWVSTGGHVFFRESCFHQSGDFKRKSNPTHYRNPREYHKIFEQLHGQEPDGTYSKFRLVDCKCVGAYVRKKRNQNQVCWLWQKVAAAGPEEMSFQKFLDTSQYTDTGILRYERIFGDGFVSTGGIETTKEFVKDLDLKAGQKVLDVGCGIGGGDFYMAEEYDVEVTGIDLSVNMVSIALERAIGRKCTVEFEVADCTTKVYPDETFDVIYSRDTILHIQDKPALFKSFFQWLKPGGRLFISDYCRGEEASSPGFVEYVKQRGYDLHSVPQYGKMIEEAGFVEVVAQDRTDQFIDILHRELKVTQEQKEDFIAEFSQDDYDHIVEGWEAKVVRCSDGEQKWGVFQGVKPRA